MAERTLPPIEQGTTTTKPKETTIVDKTTFQIKGTDSGQVYGMGRSLSEALALQTQLMSGGTPTVADRPDMFATSPKPGEEVKTITGAAGQQVQPTTATLGDLEARKAGTLTSFNQATDNPQLDAANKFNQAVKDTTQAVVTEQRNKVLSADQNFDTQLQLQRGALYAALLDETIAQEDMKWLTPAQQRAISQGDKDLIRSQIGGLNSIANARQESAAEKERQKAEDLAMATTRFNTLAELGALNLMSDEDKTALESQLSLPAGTIDQYMTKQTETGSSFEIRSGPNGTILEIETDSATGKVLNTKTISGGYTSGSDTGATGNVTTMMGNGTVTGYGSDYWPHGLDMVMDGGKGANLTMPSNFEVISVENSCQPGDASCNSGFGNQVKVMMNGREIWFSHLNSVDLAPGNYPAGTVIGTQGNTGKVYSTSGGDGTHVDITMPRDDNSFYTPQEVAEFIGANDQGTETTEVSEEEQNLGEVMSKNDFSRLFAQTYDQTYGGYSMMELGIGVSQTEIDAAYNEYLRSIQPRSSTKTIGGQTYNLKEMQDLITTTDEQKMFAQELDYNNANDIATYLKQKYGEEEGKTSTSNPFD